jgi:protoheme IX farnesyltransferase
MSNSKVVEIPPAALAIPDVVTGVVTGASPAVGLAQRVGQYWALTKPRVTLLTVFCAVIGSLLAADGAPAWSVLLYSAAGIWLLAGAAFAVNCLLEAQVDARMTRTARRAGPAQPCCTRRSIRSRCG